MTRRTRQTNHRRELWRWLTVPLALVGFLIAWASPAAAADFAVERWDLTTCATEGAPSPVVHYANNGPMGYSIGFLIDGQEYTSVRLLPGQNSDFTLPPIVSGSHVIQMGSPPTPQSPQLSVVAPQCPDGSPPPSANTFPKPPPSGQAHLWADFGVGVCALEGPAAGTAIMPFTFGNTGDADGEQFGFIDGTQVVQTMITAGSSGSSWFPLHPGEHTYEIRDAQGAVLASVTAMGISCPAESPTPTPTPTSTPTATPTVTATATATPITSPATSTSPGPQTPAVVQTDGNAPAAPVSALVAAGVLLLSGAVLIGVQDRVARAGARHLGQPGPRPRRRR